MNQPAPKWLHDLHREQAASRAAARIEAREAAEDRVRSLMQDALGPREALRRHGEDRPMRLVEDS